MGAATAEFAVIFPVVVAILVLGAGLVAVQLAQLSLNQKIGWLARMAEAGRPYLELERFASSNHIQLKATSDGGIECLAGTRELSPVHWLGASFNIPLSAKACSLIPGE